MNIRIIKRLYHGVASLRDYELEDALKHGGVKMILGNETMTLTPEQLNERKFSCHAIEIKSKFNNQTYKLIDFPWVADIKQKELAL